MHPAAPPGAGKERRLMLTMPESLLSGRNIKIALLLGMITVSIIYLLRPIMDPDFFWHLRTGQWMWENKQLLTKDIFAYTTPPVLTIWEKVALTSYWLSQVVFYLAYLSGGLSGIVALRFLVLTALLYVLGRRMRGDTVISPALLIIFVIAFLEIYPLDRPQVFSFIFFALLLNELESITLSDHPSAKPYIITLSLIMLLWANMHAGFIVGQLVILLRIVAEGMRFITAPGRPAGKGRYRTLLLAGGSGILCSLINPNTYHVLPAFLTTPLAHTQMLVEYESMISFFNTYRDGNTMVLYWMVMVLTAIAVLYRFRTSDMFRILLLSVTGFVAFKTIRYLPFFLIAALPVIDTAFSGKSCLRAKRVAFICLALFSAVFFAWDERSNIRNIGTGNWIDEERLPVKAAGFIADNDLKGNMYNQFGWGGYLIWRLGPERKVFIDGRTIFEEGFSQMAAISAARSAPIAGLPVWKSMLNTYSVNYIVIDYLNSDGRLLPLVPALLEDSDWRPVYFDAVSVIFIRNSPENFMVLSKYSIEKSRLIHDLITIFDTMIKAGIKPVFAYLSKGELYLVRQDFGRAKEAYIRTLSLDPSNKTATTKLRQLGAVMPAVDGTPR